MFLQQLYLKDIRCFDEIIIDFSDSSLSTLLLGDNGDGKSTVMRCIAIGLCDESSAAALFRELPGEFVRRRQNKKYAKRGDSGIIELTLLDEDGTNYRIKTTIKATETFERVHQNKGLEKRKKNNNKWESLNQDSFPWEKIFVSGYGPGSRTQGTADFQHYLAVDAVYSIFKYDEPLQNPELAIRRLISAAQESQKDNFQTKKRAEEMLSYIKNILANILQLSDSDHLRLSRGGVEIQGSWGRVDISELSDGYKATTTWIMDLLSWWFLRTSSRGGYHIRNIKGIVLVDEIEQHLHPRWQRKIMPLLHSSFPHIQFIVSTHSPLCAAGAADIGEKSCQLVNLERKNGKVEPRTITLPVGYRADQILTSDAFGLSDTRNPKTEEKVKTYKKLRDKKRRTTAEEAELKRLVKYVSGLPEVGQYEEEQRARVELRKMIGLLRNPASLSRKH